MKFNKTVIDTKEALNRLAHPIFFDATERKAAYEIVMKDGNPAQKASAQKASVMWPIEGLEATKA